MNHPFLQLVLSIDQIFFCIFSSIKICNWNTKLNKGSTPIIAGTKHTPEVLITLWFSERDYWLQNMKQHLQLCLVTLMEARPQLINLKNFKRMLRPSQYGN